MLRDGVPGRFPLGHAPYRVFEALDFRLYEPPCLGRLYETLELVEAQPVEVDLFFDKLGVHVAIGVVARPAPLSSSVRHVDEELKRVLHTALLS